MSADREAVAQAEKDTAEVWSKHAPEIRTALEPYAAEIASLRQALAKAEGERDEARATVIRHVSSAKTLYERTAKLAQDADAEVEALQARAAALEALCGEAERHLSNVLDNGHSYESEGQARDSASQFLAKLKDRSHV